MQMQHAIKINFLYETHTDTQMNQHLQINRQNDIIPPTSSRIFASFEIKRVHLISSPRGELNSLELQNKKLGGVK